MVLARGWQVARNHWLDRSNGWIVLDRRVGRFCTDRGRVEGCLEDLRCNPLLLTPSSVDAAHVLATRDPSWVEALRCRCDRYAGGEFPIFDQWYSLDLDALPWSSDWRFDYQWELGSARRYQFYENEKPTPYDVKFPWELSRLQMLPDLMQAAVICDNRSYAEFAVFLAKDWATKNPFAESVGWFPMECSMRVIALALALEIGVAGHCISADGATVLLGSLLRQAEYVAYNLEISGVNHNHFDANIVALQIAGDMVAQQYPPAKRWRTLAYQHLERELLVQFFSDGVNFEKALGYHRLVLELFLVSALVAQRRKHPFAEASLERLKRACEYTKAYIRPDSWAPAVGDNDSGRVLALDGRHTRDHRELLAVAAEVLEAPALKPDAESYGAAAWLAGRASSCAPSSENETLKATACFPEGGVAICRVGNDFLFVDFGEVGLLGRGGHGHNDLLSFELCLNGQPIIVDPGMPGYTGDPRMYERFRGTAAHSTVQVDGQEMAQLRGYWRIANEAIPLPSRCVTTTTTMIVSGGHDGYSRLDDPLSLRRELRLSRSGQGLTVTDSFETDGRHFIEQRLHFHPDVVLEMREGSVGVEVGGLRWAVRWEVGALPRLESGQVSHSYGMTARNQMLVLERTIEGPSTAWFTIRPDGSGHGIW